MRSAIARDTLDTVLGHAAAMPGQEVCGLLFGDAGQIAAVLPCANVAAEPAHSFELDPAALFAAQRAERSGGPRVIGHYHSHPAGDPVPSPRDAAAAFDTGRLWLIVAGQRAGLWRAEAGGRFSAVALEIA